MFITDKSKLKIQAQIQNILKKYPNFKVIFQFIRLPF